MSLTWPGGTLSPENADPLGDPHLGEAIAVLPAHRDQKTKCKLLRATEHCAYEGARVYYSRSGGAGLGGQSQEFVTSSTPPSLPSWISGRRVYLTTSLPGTLSPVSLPRGQQSPSHTITLTLAPFP